MPNHPARPKRAGALALAAALALTACSARPAGPGPTSPATVAAPAETRATVDAGGAPTGRPSTGDEGPAPRCLDDDHSLAPGGYCLYPAKVTWPAWDILPVDPAALDFTDPDAVATAYVITANTWDSATDRSGAYATRRAAILTSQGRAHPDTTDPDTARGQAEFTNTWQAGSYTTCKIHSVTTEGLNGSPLQPDGTWRRVVSYTREVHTRADGKTPIRRTGSIFLTLAPDPSSGQWLITQASTASETDASPTTS